MSLSLLLQQCPACLVRLTWIVFVMRGRCRIVGALWGVAARTYSILLATFLCNCRLAFYPAVLLASKLYIRRTSIDKISENGFELTKKKRSRRYPAKAITDADYAGDIAILANTTKPKHYCIVWNELLLALVSMSMHAELYMCAIIKQATFPHETEPFWNW